MGTYAEVSWLHLAICGLLTTFLLRTTAAQGTSPATPPPSKGSSHNGVLIGVICGILGFIVLKSGTPAGMTPVLTLSRLRNLARGAVQRKPLLSAGGCSSMDAAPSPSQLKA